MKNAWTAALVTLVVLAWSSAPQAALITLDFDEPSFAVTNPPDGDPGSGHPLINTPSHSSHGRVVTSTTGSNGTVAVGVSASGGSGLAVIFDTRRESTADGDLEDNFGQAIDENSNSGFLPYPITPAGGPSYPAGRRPGHVLIVNTNDTGCNTSGDTTCSDPNDDASGSEIEFDFSNFTDGVSLEQIDIADIDEGNIGSEEVTLTLYSAADPTVVIGSETFGDGNREIGDGNIARLDLQQFFMGNAGVGRLVVEFSSSGALTNLVFSTPMNGNQVPEPATLALFGFGLAGLGVLHRRRSKARHDGARLT